MSYPTSDTAVQRPDLGEIAFETMRDAGLMGYVGLQVMPLFDTAKQAANYAVIPAEVMLNIEKTRRKSRGAYNRSDWESEDGFYSTVENGWEEVVDDREKSLNLSRYDDEVLATEIAMGVILRGQEQRVANKVFNATVFTNTTAVTHEWDDAANAVPLTDVKAAKKDIRSRGVLANAMIMNFDVYENIKSCASIIDRLKYTFPMIDMEAVGAAELARIFNLQYIIIAGSIYNSADKGQDASIGNIWSDEYCMITRISTSRNIMDPCIGRTFLWTDESPENIVVEMYREEGVRGDIVRVRHDTDESYIRSYDADKAVKSDISLACSHLLSNITT